MCGVAIDVGAARERRRRHLVRRAADVERGAGDAFCLERCGERRLVDQIAARQIDEIGRLLHRREGRSVHQVFGRLVGDGEADDEIGARQEIGQRDLRQPRGDDFFIGIGDQHRHAEGEREVGEIFADHAIADDADGCAFQLPAHARLRHAAGVIGLGGLA